MSMTNLLKIIPEILRSVIPVRAEPVEARTEAIEDHCTWTGSARTKFRDTLTVIALASCLVASLNTAGADNNSDRALTIKLPPETVSFKPAPGAGIANANCQICHSADYISTQPVSTSREEWIEIVEKMQSTYGAPIQTDQIPPLVDYLVKNYGDEIDQGRSAPATIRVK